jgi:hypothetical protein
MVSKGSQRGLGLPSLWLACELRAISVLIARFGVTCPYSILVRRKRGKLPETIGSLLPYNQAIEAR